VRCARRATSADQQSRLEDGGKDLVVVLGAFAGDVWTARDASGHP
jgi:hypothetical protein